MRILKITIYNDFKFGGPPRKIRELSAGLAARGHDVHILTFTRRGCPDSPFEDVGGVQVLEVPWVGKELRQLPVSPSRVLQAVSRSDVVHCYGLYNLLCPAAALAAWRMGRPYLVEPLGMYIPRTRHQRIKRFYHWMFSAWMMREAAGVIATSASEATELVPCVRPERLFVRGNGLEAAPFEGMSDGEDFRARCGITNGERIVLYIGRISRIKNLEVLVLAFEKAALACTRLVLVGPMMESDYSTKLRRLIKARGLTETVLLAGPLYGETKLAALAASNLFVLPSLYESFGNAAAEAVAAGVPVLLTTTCGIAPLVHQRAGLAVEPDCASLAAGLRTLMDDVVERAALTSRRREALDELSWQGPLSQMEAIYQRAILASPSHRQAVETSHGR